jgi:hypothetical protein
MIQQSPFLTLVLALGFTNLNYLALFPWKGNIHYHGFASRKWMLVASAWDVAFQHAPQLLIHGHNIYVLSDGFTRFAGRVPPILLATSALTAVCLALQLARKWVFSGEGSHGGPAYAQGEMAEARQLFFAHRRPGEGDAIPFGDLRGLLDELGFEPPEVAWLWKTDGVDDAARASDILHWDEFLKFYDKIRARALANQMEAIRAQKLEMEKELADMKRRNVDQKQVLEQMHKMQKLQTQQLGQFNSRLSSKRRSSLMAGAGGRRKSSMWNAVQGLLGAEGAGGGRRTSCTGTSS